MPRYVEPTTARARSIGTVSAHSSSSGSGSANAERERRRAARGTRRASRTRAADQPDDDDGRVPGRLEHGVELGLREQHDDEREDEERELAGERACR